MFASDQQKKSYVVRVQSGQMDDVKRIFNENADLGVIMYETARMLKVFSNRSLEDIQEQLAGIATVALETFGRVAP